MPIQPIELRHGAGELGCSTAPLVTIRSRTWRELPVKNGALSRPAGLC